MPGKQRAHYGGDYAARARAVRRAAWANPATLCARCGKTLAEHPRRNGKLPRWDAGHINDGQINGPLQPEVDHCNRSAGATMGNKQRAPLQVTEDW